MDINAHVFRRAWNTRENEIFMFDVNFSSKGASILRECIYYVTAIDEGGHTKHGMRVL